MKFKKLVESFGSENTMTIRVASGLNADGCDIVVTDAEGNILHKEEYRYGYNASYNRKFAKYAQDDYDNAIKYNWKNRPSLKPFIGDIVHDLCAQYDINEDDIIYEKGKHLFMNTDVSDADVDRFKSCLKESTDRYKKGDGIELSNGQIGIVAADYVVGEDRVADEAIAKPHDSSNDYTEADVERIRRDFEEAGFNASSYNGYDVYTLADDSGYVGKCVFDWKFANPRTNAFSCELKYTVKKKEHFAAPSVAIDFLRSGVYDKGLHESFEMASIGAGLDDNGEIAAMRAEQKDLEKRRAARKERFALMHKLFDKHMNNDPNGRWIDKIYDLFDEAESVTFIGDKYSLIPSRTGDDQPVRYRYSEKGYDFYSDPYWEIIYVATNNVDPLKEDLEDDFDLYMKASDFKCKLSRYDVEEAANPDELIIYMEDVYSILSDEYGAENIKWWKFYEDDDVDFGYKVCLKDGSKHIVEINNDRVDEVNEALEEERKTQYVICGVTNDGTRMLYDAVNDNFTTDYDSATKYDDMDVARDDWFKIPRSGFRRIFIPVYDPAVFESLHEGTGADTAHTVSNALKIASQEDKHKWAKTVSEIIDVIPDEFADQMFDVVKEKASDIKLSAENRKKLVDASSGELTEEDVKDCDTLGKILALVDGFEWADKNPGLLKGYIMVVLSIVAIIEPTPVLEIITLIIGFLPEKWVAKVLAVTNVIGNPLGAAGTAVNKIYKAVKKKDEAFDADKVQKRIACTTEFDNGHVFHNDYFRASSAEAEERAKQASIENPDKVFYVKYDDVMNPSSDIKWKNGEQLNEADALIYFDPDEEFEIDFRYYVYDSNDEVVSDGFEFEDDAIEWAQDNGYPVVKIHNYYRDNDDQLNPDGDPEVIWHS